MHCTRARERRAAPACSPSGRAGRTAAPRAYWAAASRWAPTDDARTAAWGANRSTASPSSAASAWWASRARSGDRSSRQRRQAFLCKRQPGVGRQRFLDGHPRELVAERDAPGSAAEHPGRQALLEAVERIAGKRLEEPDLGVGGDGHDASSSARAAGLEARGPRQHRVANRRGDLLLPAASDLGDEERIAAGCGRARRRRSRGAARAPRPPPERAGAKCQVDRPLPAELAEHDPQRVARSSSSSR